MTYGPTPNTKRMGVQGIKKQTVKKNLPECKEQPSKNNTDIAGSINKSMTSLITKNDHVITEKVKIQGGGQDGQDKVQLSVMFGHKNILNSADNSQVHPLRDAGTLKLKNMQTTEHHPLRGTGTLKLKNMESEYVVDGKG